MVPWLKGQRSVITFLALMAEIQLLLILCPMDVTHLANLHGTDWDIGPLVPDQIFKSCCLKSAWQPF